MAIRKGIKNSMNKPVKGRVPFLGAEITMKRKTWAGFFLVGLLAVNNFAARDSGEDVGKGLRLAGPAAVDGVVGMGKFLGGVMSGASDGKSDVSKTPSVDIPTIELPQIDGTTEQTQESTPTVNAGEGWGDFLIRAYNMSPSAAYNCIEDNDLEGVTIFSGQPVENPCN